MFAVLTAIALGALIGVERELARRPAGLRTHMLVAGTSALLVSLVTPLIQNLQKVVGTSALQADPVRIIEAIVTGVAFIGAGTIIRRKDDIDGLTTAASLLFTAVIGITVALDHYLTAVLCSFLVVGILSAVKRLEAKILHKWPRKK